MMKFDCENLDDLRETLEAVLRDPCMHTNLWERVRRAQEFLNRPEHRLPVYVILGEPGPHQEFVEVENNEGRGVPLGIGQERYPGHDGLWRLGPLWAFPAKPLQEPVPEAPAPPVSKVAPGEGQENPGAGPDDPPTLEMPPNRHELVININSEADAQCKCGKWRLLRVSTGGRESDRQAEIEMAFEMHLDQAKFADAHHSVG